MKRFVKAGNTDVSVTRSQGELERVLRRYGAVGFGVQSDYQTHLVRISFRVPDTPGSTVVVPIRLEVSIEAIARALGFLAHALVKSPDGTIKRVVEMLDSAAGEGGYRALLPAST